MSDGYPSPAAELGKLVLAVFALVLAYVLVGLGPIGWIVLVVLLFVASSVLLKGRERDERTPDRVNCPACGAPSDPDEAVWEYCEEPLTGP